MQTFLPYKDFKRSAQCLDWQRLEKQRSECKQILLALMQGPKVLYDTINKSYVYGPIPKIIPDDHRIRTTPWYNHPATKMWRGYEHTLIHYALIVCTEWINRGYKDSLYPYFTNCISQGKWDKSIVIIPPWLTDDFCKSHQSNLVRKLPAHYRQHFPHIPDNLPYLWPV